MAIASPGMSPDADDAVVRQATEDDVSAILGLVRGLAEYEREPEAVVATETDLRTALFGPRPAVFCHLVERAGTVVGFALWFLNFSTWTGRHGIYLEDLYVLPEQRGRGYGRALMSTLARQCVARGYGRFEWAVLDWNDPAIGFYRAIGAVGLDEWTTQRLSGEALTAFAGNRHPFRRGQAQ